MRNSELLIDLSDIKLDDVQILSMEGGRAIPEFAASSGTQCCGVGACSCSAEEGSVA